MLSSATDQGFYVRTGCTGPQLACIETADRSRDERTDIAVDGGVPLFIFVEPWPLAGRRSLHAQPLLHARPLSSAR